MLSADLVRARRQKGELLVSPLDGKTRARALELAETYLAIANDLVGQTRDELRQAWSAVPIAGREKKLADGLMKLAEDACELAQETPRDPIELRRALFDAASKARASGTPFDRSAVLGAVASELGMTAEALEQGLFADLRGAHTLLRIEPLVSKQLVDRYDAAQIQSVLLRAVRVVAEVRSAVPEGYRTLFRALKFRRLLHRIEPLPASDGYRITIDGPYSLFDAVTKYGLQLALVLPSLQAMDQVALTADVRWGKAREKLTFRWSHRRDRLASADDTGTAELSDDLRALLESFGELDTPWRASRSTEIFDLPGVGLCVPDLVFERPKRKRVFLELLGFWSRDAVWKRVELAEQGLPEPMLFAVSSRLRVSEEVLDDATHAALYVFKGTPSARAIEKRLEGLSRKA